MKINVDKLIVERIEDIDFHGMARDELKGYIRREVSSTIKKMVEEEVQKIIQAEIAKALEGEVATDDGWGHTAKYASFEDLFRQTFKAAMDKSWDAKREIEKQVAAKVDALIKGEMQAVVSKIADAIIKTRS